VRTAARSLTASKRLVRRRSTANGHSFPYPVCEASFGTLLLEDLNSSRACTCLEGEATQGRLQLRRSIGGRSSLRHGCPLRRGIRPSTGDIDSIVREGTAPGQRAERRREQGKAQAGRPNACKEGSLGPWPIRLLAPCLGDSLWLQ